MEAYENKEQELKKNLFDLAKELAILVDEIDRKKLAEKQF